MSSHQPTIKPISGTFEFNLPDYGRLNEQVTQSHFQSHRIRIAYISPEDIFIIHVVCIITVRHYKLCTYACAVASRKINI